MKIAIYSGSIPSTTFIERLISGLAASGVQIEVYGPRSGAYKKSSNVTTLGYSWQIDKFLYWMKYFLLLRVFRQKDKKKLDNLIKGMNGRKMVFQIRFYPVLYHRPDIFHLQWVKGIEDWTWVTEFGMKLVVSLRGTHLTISPFTVPQLSETYLKNFPKVDHFHAVSEDMKNRTIQFLRRTEKVSVIYSGIPLDDFEFVGYKKKKEPVQVISVGRHHWVKGYQTALDACKLLKQKSVRFHYSLIGVGFPEELIYQRHQSNLKEEVHFYSTLPFSEVKKKISEADILLLPSLIEGIANVAIEAMAMGKIVVAADCGGMPELIQDAKNGFLVPPNDPEALAQKIIEILKLIPEQWNTIGMEARRKVEQSFQQQQMINGMISMYQSTLNPVN